MEKEIMINDLFKDRSKVKIVVNSFGSVFLLRDYNGKTYRAKYSLSEIAIIDEDLSMRRFSIEKKRKENKLNKEAV